MQETPDLDKYLGRKPHVRFLESTWPGSTFEQRESVVTALPKRLSPEEKFRMIERKLPLRHTPHLRTVLDNLYRVFEEKGPFGGILGYSEGATVAATFVMDFLGRHATEGLEMPLKCAIFISGSAPFASDGGALVLADTSGQAITIPTCHVLAYNDTMLFESLALFDVCQQDVASVVDHGRGHLFPTESAAQKLVTNAIRDLIARTRTSRVKAEPVLR